jgi:hypothetical protein
VDCRLVWAILSRCESAYADYIEPEAALWRHKLFGFSVVRAVNQRRFGLGCRMSDDLNKLLEAAKAAKPTAEHREQQRRSFAYGNTAFENDLITREMIDRQAEELARETDDGRGG